MVYLVLRGLNLFQGWVTLLQEPSPAGGKSDKGSGKSKPKGYKWLLASTGKILFVAGCLTISYVGFLLLDAGVLAIIGFLIRDLIVEYTFVQNGFDGLRIFSAIIISLTYLFHLLYATYDQVHFIIRVSRSLRKEEEEDHEGKSS